MDIINSFKEYIGDSFIITLQNIESSQEELKPKYESSRYIIDISLIVEKSLPYVTPAYFTAKQKEQCRRACIKNNTEPTLIKISETTNLDQLKKDPTNPEFAKKALLLPQLGKIELPKS